MLFKLLKYDFRAMWKQFALIWGAALALALVNRFSIFLNADGRETHFRSASLSAVPVFAFTAALIAMFVISVIFVIQRFSKGLLGDEGYLMHTLPVRPWELVASKLICGIVTWVLSGMVALLSPVLMIPLNLPDLLQFPWVKLLCGILKHPNTILLMMGFCLLVISSIALFISVMYLSIAIGHLVSRHRKLICTAAFIGLYIVLLNFYARISSIALVRWLMDLNTSGAGAMFKCSAFVLVPALALLAAVCWILENKLNLE